MEEPQLQLDPEPAYLRAPPGSSVDPPVMTALQTLPLGALQWEDFEKLCVRVLQATYRPLHVQLYGVRGQGQQGIDAFARFSEPHEYVALQSRRVREVTPGSITAAVDDFVAGSWSARAKTFIYATSASLSATALADQVEAESSRLSAQQIGFQTWDRDHLSMVLKGEPAIVADFFGLPWRKAFCSDGLIVSEETDELARKIFGAHLEDFVRLGRLDDWDEWTSSLVSHGQPSLGFAVHRRMWDLMKWLQTRHWPDGYPALGDAFSNLGLVLQDLLAGFDEHADDQHGVFLTRRFYKISDWNPDEYSRLLREFNEHVAMVENLTLELTRAANYVCDTARAFLDPAFRAKDAVLTVVTGPNQSYEWERWRPEYRGAERIRIPYPGLEVFKRITAERDFAFTA